MRTARLLLLLANLALFAAWLGRFYPHGTPGRTATNRERRRRSPVTGHPAAKLGR